MYSSPASSLSSPSLSSPDTSSLPDTPPVQSTSSLPLLPPPLITSALLDQTRPKRDCRPFPPMTVLDHTGSPMDQRPYISRRVSFPSFPPPPPRIDPYLLPSISSLMLAPISPWDYSTQLQFALDSAQAGPYLHPFGRGHQHYQTHIQPGGHIIPGVGAGIGRDLDHHHPGEHSLAGLLGGNRKRPKYTRSKTGCLTCRTKKIKCDETKPICTKCVHGQRECTWPKDVQVNPSATSSTPNSRPSTTTGTPQRSPSRPGPSSGLSRSGSTNGRAGSNFLSSSERGSSSAGTPSRETSPQERLDSQTRNSTESRTHGLVVPHSGSSLSGLTSDSDPLTFPQPLDMTSFGNSGVGSFPLSAQFGGLPMGYNDELSMLNQPLSVDNPASYSPWAPSSYGNNSPIDTSTANGQWSATSNQLLTNPDPIAPFFRSVQERNLVLVSPSSYY